MCLLTPSRASPPPVAPPPTAEFDTLRSASRTRNANRSSHITRNPDRQDTHRLHPSLSPAHLGLRTTPAVQYTGGRLRRHPHGGRDILPRRATGGRLMTAHTSIANAPNSACRWSAPHLPRSAAPLSRHLSTLPHEHAPALGAVSSGAPAQSDRPSRHQLSPSQGGSQA
jgi:hypothetical protein